MILFDKQYQGTLNFASQDVWIDLGLIPNALYLLFGFATYISDGKRIVFELRTNKAGFSDAVAVNTDLIDRVGVLDGDSKDREYYRNAQTARRSATSTGIEHA